MKTIFASILLIGLCVGAHGATTCLHNRTGVFTIKKSENGVSSSSSASDMTWSVRFNYDLVPNDSSFRTINGLATCNEITTNTDGGAVASGNANVYLRASSADEGTQCWCSMEGPVSSWWVFLKGYSDEDTCKSGCARDCAAAFKDDTNKFRSRGVYMAIW